MLWASLPIVIVLVVALLALPRVLRVVNRYVIYPWKSRHRSLAVELPWTATGIHSASPDAAERLAATARALAECGFVAAAHFHQDVPMGASNRSAYLSIWLNDRDGAVARVIWARMAQPSLRYGLTTFALSFATTWDDGSDVVTTNAATVPTFPPDPKSNVVGWKDMNSASVLYKLHRARAERARGGRGTVIPAATVAGMERLMHDTEQRALSSAIEHGYLRRDRGGELRTTLRGAYLMTWRILWPWRHLTQARQARKLRRALAESPEVAAEARLLPFSPPAMQERIG